MSNHTLSRADNIFAGPAIFPPFHKNSFANTSGAPLTFVRQVDLGSPITLDANGLVDGATSTELPNNATKTYTTANDGSSPFDNADTPAVASIVDSTGTTRSVWPLDVPRNLTAAVTHASSAVAMTIVVTGFDVYGQKMVETLSTAATGQSQAAAGKKAFKSILSIAITSAGNATTNTLSLGWGDVLGLPFKADLKADVLRVSFNDAWDDSATIVAADDTTATATTGDVRGTVDTNSAADGSRVIVWMKADGTTKESLVGIAQYSV
jgi:hypothetical protein